ncbi:hypothetical protein CY34DRAFT_814400 [Suillus luteus UH-Slu-Lm8-n1]|uniref:Uncharacterized protein n=1 Tax=Suillus luteus UH-Slu-Lm8-n1 TaxID=930992 RepID=A0A0C9ZSB6_9AGAM|nr:hypothetical protein CY34DRAFT_814400 [Suillus luteus UH-Slu-Lm8-n1]
MTGNYGARWSVSVSKPIARFLSDSHSRYDPCVSPAAVGPRLDICAPPLVWPR